jgi:hypothetical protein
MATFRCKRSGNTVSFTNPDDIKQMRVHEGYEEIPDEKETDEKQEANEKRPVLKLPKTAKSSDKRQ